MKNKTKTQLQAELKELAENMKSVRLAAGRMRKDIFELGLGPKDRGTVMALVDTFMTSL